MNPSQSPKLTLAPEALVQRTVKLRHGQALTLEAMARQQERSVSFLVRDAVAAYLAQSAKR